MPYVYNWQAGRDDFTKWMITTLVDPDLIEQLREPTEGFTRIELTMQINGVTVPVDRFIAGIERNMRHLAKEEARELVASIPRLERLRDGMDRADQELRAHLRDVLHEAGVELGDEGAGE